MKTVETSKSNNKIKITPTIIQTVKESVELIEEKDSQEQLIKKLSITSTDIRLDNIDNEMNLYNVDNNGSNILTLDNYIGQQKIVDLLRVSISAAIKRNEVLGHILLVGERGSGKTTLIDTIANEMNTQAKKVSFSTIKKESELATILSCLCQGEILVIENFNKIPFDCISLLSSAMDNYYFDIKIGKGPSARNIRFDLPPFTIIAVMEENQSIPQELMDCFSIVASMERYSPLELCNLAMKYADSIKVEITKDAALCLVKYADGSYRNMTKIIKRAADFALIRNNNIIDTNIANTVIETLGLFRITIIKDD